MHACSFSRALVRCERMPVLFQIRDFLCPLRDAINNLPVWFFFCVLSPTRDCCCCFAQDFSLSLLFSRSRSAHRQPSTRLSRRPPPRAARATLFQVVCAAQQCRDRKSIYNPSDRSRDFFSTQLSVNRVGMWTRKIRKNLQISSNSFLCVDRTILNRIKRKFSQFLVHTLQTRKKTERKSEWRQWKCSWYYQLLCWPYASSRWVRAHPLHLPA